MAVTDNSADNRSAGRGSAERESSASDTIHRPPGSASKRLGYVIGAAVNAVMLWVAHQLLEWEWPGFLTAEFEDVLPWLTASCLVSIAGYGLMFVRVERLLPKLVNDAATAIASFLTTLELLRVFPFDFTGHPHDWSWLIRLILVIALIGAVIAIAVATVKLLFWPLRKPVSGT